MTHVNLIPGKNPCLRANIPLHLNSTRSLLRSKPSAQGKKAEAKASFATSLKLNPNQKDVAEALKRVS